MFGRSNKAKKLPWWEQADKDYPPGSSWLYMGKPCMVKRTHYWTLDGFPVQSPQIQYFDDVGVIHTTEVCLSALEKIIQKEAQ